MTILFIDYDPVRGGFELRFGDPRGVATGDPYTGKISIFRHEANDKITGIWSEGEANGIHLLGDDEFSGIAHDIIHVRQNGPTPGPIQVVQTETDFTVKFAPHLLPENQVLRTETFASDAVQVSFLEGEPPRVASIRFKSDAVAAVFPIREIHTKWETFQ